MTKETYDKYNKVGKHEKKWYSVWRVLGPGGPEDAMSVYGLENAAKYTSGCWDYTVRRPDGTFVPENIISYYRKVGKHACT